MTGHACLQSTSYFFPALTLLTFWVTFCVTFHLTNTPQNDRHDKIIYIFPLLRGWFFEPFYKLKARLMLKNSRISSAHER